jgi:hypothetical protein
MHDDDDLPEGERDTIPLLPAAEEAPPPREEMH